MTVLTPLEVAEYWIGAGGPKSRAVEWLAIAMGESGLDDTIVSPAGAIGVWQIMPFNASIGGGTVGDLDNPAYNARVAVIMSGGGVNCAAWDSAYLDIQRSGRYSYLAWPEVGSPDYINLAYAQADLAGHGLSGITDPGTPGMPGSIDGVVAKMNAITDVALPKLTAQTSALAPVIGLSFMRGWRP